MSTPTVLFIGLVWPEPTSSAAGQRIVQLAELFSRSSYSVYFSSASAATEHSADLSQLCTGTFQIQLNSDSFDLLLRRLRPAIVVFDRFITEEQYGWRVAQVVPRSIRILDSEDLQCLRKVRQSATKRGVSFLPEQILSEDFAKREIASILRCDLTLVISTYEMELLQAIFNIDPELLFYLPLFGKIKPAPATLRSNFMFIGNFHHAPNTDAVEFLNREIWPLIVAELPQSELHIWGAYASKEIEQLTAVASGFIVKGRAADVHETLFKYKLMLAPLRFGAGIKGKLLCAMETATPSITTSIGAEGMTSGKWGGAIEDDPAAFAKAAVELYINESKWLGASETSQTLVSEHFSIELFEDAFLHAIKDLEHNLEKRRSRNFLGSMLMHHTMRSTEYMSRWISEKNKKNPL